ncbi:MAG: ABC transporter permease, partial [Betaproteobacteria bacterium]
MTAAAARAPAKPDGLRWAPAVTTGVFLVPIGAGLVGTLLPAFGYLPAIGGQQLSFAPWRELWAYPGFATSLWLTLFTGTLTTLLTVVLAVGLVAFAYGRPWTRRLGTFLAPLLSTPHSALAIGFVFLIAPSGWLVRLVSPGLTGWSTPPDF